MKPIILKPKRELQSNAVNVDVDVSKLRVDIDQEITQQVIYLIQDKIILTHGGLLILNGKPKSRKSTFLHTFLATSILKTSIWGIKSHLNDQKSGIVLIDTEQTLYDLVHSLRRLENAFNVKLSTYPNFQAFTTRSLIFDHMYYTIEKIVDQNPNVGLVAIDGLIDLVNDINDVREAKACIHFLKTLADKKNIGIVGIIHQNKGTNYSLGHLGSFASRFAQSELSVEKTDQGSSILKPIYLRSTDTFEQIEIDFDKQNNRYDIISNITTESNINQVQIVDAVFNGKVAITYAELCSGLKMQIDCTMYAIQKKIVPQLYADALIKKCGNLIQKSFGSSQ